MNSERRTDNYYRSAKAKRKRRNRQIVMMRSIMLIASLLVIVLFVVVLILNYNKNKITDYYDTESRYLSLMDLDLGTDALKPFATDLSVICDQSNDDNFTAGSGLLVTLGQPEAIFNKCATDRVDPASTTKIMTALIAIKYGNLTDPVTITEDAMDLESGASLAKIEPGMTMSLEQLLYGLLLPSGNDAANAIAIHMGGSIKGFAEMMNKEARALAAVDSHFTNAHGMTEDNHYTTAYDLYLIINEALKYPQFREICEDQKYIAEFIGPDGLAMSKTWENTNRYLTGDAELPPGFTVIGGKTGTTQAAGNCLVLATAQDNGQEHISVVMKADSKDALYQNMNYLLGKVN